MQEADVLPGDGSLTLMPKFIVDSPDQGYFLVITYDSSSSGRMMAVLNSSAPAVVTGLEPNTYDILAYDVEETGLPNEIPAVQINIELSTVSQGK